jgi:uncharacterized protein YfaS (alpha-2-macroglobulin family)
MSMAMPALILSSRPELGNVIPEHGASGFSGLFNELAIRQRPEGDFALWNHGGYSVEPVSIYTMQFLLEASERGFSVPPGMIDAGNRFLATVARRVGGGYYEDRDAAYAIYLLTRQGQLMSAEADALVARLDKRDKGWRQDSPALWLAAAYQRMQQPGVANELVNGVIATNRGAYGTYGMFAYNHGFYYYDPMAADAELLYILARHFPNQLAQYGPLLANELVDGINGGGYYSYSSGTTLLALDVYAGVSQKEEGKVRLAEIAGNGSVTPLALPATPMPKVDVSSAATKLRVYNDGTLPAFGVLAELGFPRHPPAAESHGIEVLREFTDDSGAVVDKAVLGQELTVRIKLRAVDRAAVTGVAMVDLLPGGFEIVQPPPVAAEQTMEQAQAGAPAQEDNNDAAPADDNSDAADNPGTGAPAAAGSCNCDWVKLERGVLQFAEPREDRAVLYADAQRDTQIYSYRIKAVTAGKFVVPPTYGEAMYDRKVYAFSAPDSIEVTKP